MDVARTEQIESDLNRLIEKRHDQGRLEAEYLERKAQIRAGESLSWEKKELAKKRLGDEYHRARKEMEAA